MVLDETMNDLFRDYFPEEKGATVWDFHNFVCLLRNSKSLSPSLSYKEALALWLQVADEKEFVHEADFPDLLSTLAPMLGFSRTSALQNEIWEQLDKFFEPLPPEPQDLALTNPKAANLPPQPKSVEGVLIQKAADAAALKKREKKTDVSRKPEPKWGEICYFAKPVPPELCVVPPDLVRHRRAELQPRTDRSTRLPLREPVRAICIVEPLEQPLCPENILVHIDAALVRRNKRDIEGSLALLLRARMLWREERVPKVNHVKAMIHLLEETEPTTAVPLHAEVYFFLTFAALAELLGHEDTSLVLVWRIKMFYEKSALGEPDDLTMGVILDHIGLLTFHAMDYDVAARCYLTIAKLRERRTGDSIITAVAYHNLGASYFQLGRSHEAGAYFDLACAIFQFSLGDSDSRTQICRWNLMKVRQSYAKPLLSVPHIYYIPIKDLERTKKKKRKVSKGAKGPKKKK